MATWVSARARSRLSGVTSTSTASASPATSCVTATCWSAVKRQMRRLRWGRPRKNVESAASSRLSPARHATKRYGPSPTGARPNAALLPAGAGIEVKHQGGGRIPLPAFGEQRLKVFVADRVARRPQVGQFQKELVGHVARDRAIADGGQQDVGLPPGGDDERAAVVPRAAALAGAADDEQQPRERGGSGQTGRRSDGRHGAVRFHGLVSGARSRWGLKTR